MRVLAPTLLGPDHRLDSFESGVVGLDDWLKRRARSNQVHGASRTYVLAQADGTVLGYYALASGGLALSEASGSIRRNMSDPIPMAILGRLAIDRRHQGKGFGVALLQDAVMRVGQAAAIMGIKGILVHAISDEAKRFYERYGFTAGVNQPMTLVLPIRQPV